LDRKLIDFLVKQRDATQMMADSYNEYLESLAPQETKDHVAETIFFALKFEAQQGLKIGTFEVAFKANNSNIADKWTLAYDVLSKASATIKERYQGKEYQFSYWLYGEDKIFKQKIAKKGDEP
jgi:hypothetical protein